MSDRYGALKRQLSGELAAAAGAYLAPAFSRLYREPRPGDAEAQALVGNLCAGAELQLKAFLAHANPALIFKDVPPEARAFLLAPDEAPDAFNWRPFGLDLRDFAYDTVSFEDAVKAFYVFFPERRQALRPYFKLAIELRKLALHGSLGPVRKDELDRAAHLALSLVQAVASRRKECAAFSPGDADRRFAAAYGASRARQVKERLAAARQKAATLKLDIAYNEAAPPAGWDALDTRCPVCKNWGVLGGTTDIRCEEKDGEEQESLDFAADSFTCDACGLLLEDVEELKLADMPVEYDRSEDLERWRDETRGTP